MLSLRKALDGMYYLLLAMAGYFFKGGEPEGHWWGVPRQLLGLADKVTREPFLSLLNGYAPDGKKLVQNAGSATRIPAFDFCFSCPKSVSLLWSIAPPPLRELIQRLMRLAVELTLADLEKQIGYIRRGKGGWKRVPARLLAALFEHGSSRGANPDMNLHMHAVVVNIGFADDGTATLDGRLIYRFKMLGGAIFRRHLGTLLSQHLGWSLQKNKNLFEVSGIKPSLIEAFSTRRRQILAEMRRRRWTTSRGAEISAINTRPGKTQLSRAQLHELWSNRIRDLGYRPKSFAKYFQDVAIPDELALASPLSDEKAIELLLPPIRQELETLLMQKAYVPRRVILTTALTTTIELPVTADQVRLAVDHLLVTDPNFVCIDRGHPYEQVTTQSNLRKERELLASLTKLAKQNTKAVRPSIIERIRKRRGLKSRKGHRLSDQQLAVVEHFLSPSCFKLVAGMPGAGKTLTLGVANEAWKRSGRKVIGVALSGRAARNLQEKAGIKSYTLAKLKSDLSLSKVSQLRDILVTAVNGKSKFAVEKLKIAANTVLVVDEASQLDTNTALALTDAIAKAGAELLWIGDRNQLGSYEAGQPFGSVQDRIEHGVLSEIRRQKNPADIQAIHDIARGEAELAIKSFRERGNLIVKEDRTQAMEQMIKDWAERGGLQHPEDHLILVTNNEERKEINKICQELRREAHQLGWFTASNGEESFARNDQVMFLKNNRKMDVNNGDIGTVTSVNPIDKHITVEIEGRKPVEVNLNEYQEICTSYCLTVAKAQGSDFKDTYVLLGGEQQSAKLTYTAISRHTDTVRLYANKGDCGDNLEGLISRLKAEPEPGLAIDLIDPPTYSRSPDEPKPDLGGSRELTPPEVALPTDDRTDKSLRPSEEREIEAPVHKPSISSASDIPATATPESSEHNVDNQERLRIPAFRLRGSENDPLIANLPSEKDRTPERKIQDLYLGDPSTLEQFQDEQIIRPPFAQIISAEKEFSLPSFRTPTSEDKEHESLSQTLTRSLPHADDSKTKLPDFRTRNGEIQQQLVNEPHPESEQQERRITDFRRYSQEHERLPVDVPLKSTSEAKLLPQSQETILSGDDRLASKESTREPVDKSIDSESASQRIERVLSEWKKELQKSMRPSRHEPSLIEPEEKEGIHQLLVDRETERLRAIRLEQMARDEGHVPGRMSPGS